MMYDRILVTGGTGVAGSALKAIRDQYPENEFIFVGSKDCNLTNQDATFALIGRCAPDAIIHLAAVSGGIGLTRHASMLRDNVFMNFNILEAARHCGVKKVVMTLSNGMYPADSPLPLKEEDMHNGYPHESNYAYAFAKRLVDPAIKAYRSEYKMNVIGLTPNGIFGENDNFHVEHAPMVPSLVRRFYENREGDSEIMVWGDGTPLRQYTYARDLAKAFMWCLLSYNGGQCLNVGTQEEHSVREIAFVIADILGIDRRRIVFDKTKPRGIYRRTMDNSTFVRISNFKYTPFRIGIENTVKWFADANENHPERLRSYDKAANYS